MKKYPFYLIVFQISLLLLFSFTIMYAHADDNFEMLVKGGFEYGSMAGWTQKGGNSFWWENMPKYGDNEYGFVVYEGDWRVMDTIRIKY